MVLMSSVSGGGQGSEILKNLIFPWIFRLGGNGLLGGLSDALPKAFQHPSVISLGEDQKIVGRPAGRPSEDD